MHRSCTRYNINELIRCDLTITVPETSFNDLSSNITCLITRFINNGVSEVVKYIE